MLRVHVGCGAVYLRDWVNVDVWETGAALAKDEPKRAEELATTEDDYYSKQNVRTAEDIAKAGPKPTNCNVCDVYGSWSNLPFADESADQLLSRQCFEHLSKTEARYALIEARRVLKPDGLLRLDVPDHEASFKQYVDFSMQAARAKDKPTKDALQAKADFMLRHLLGSRKDDFAYHMGSWTKERLIQYCGEHGFDLVEEEPNIHCYPAICLKFRKSGKRLQSDLNFMPWRAAWEYASRERGSPIIVPDDWNVLEVGPGLNPWPRANVYFDVDEGNVQRLRAEGKQIENVNVEYISPHYDGKFDFALISHVLEHCESPERACASLARIAKRGVIVCPSPMKEGLFCAHEPDHRWWVIQSQFADCLHFHPIPHYRHPEGWGKKLYALLDDRDVSGEQHRLWRYGEKRLEGIADKLRAWFHHAEPHLDSILWWEGKPNIVQHNS